jgi:ABC-type bacteriocin/lantibiotic exporter with double-glycine peptidase domain
LKLCTAFYRLLDPKVHIAIFDEPMSSCDMETRKRFYRCLRNFPDKTIIVIAHDPFYLHHFDRVIVMENGEIIDDIRGKAILEYRNQIIDNL